MKLVDKLVLKDIFPMFLIGVAMFASLWFAADPILVAMRFIAQGVSWFLVAEIVLLQIPMIIGYTLPMGVLISALIGFGRLSSDSEAVALFAGGIPFARIAMPAIILGLFASLFGYVINDRIAAHMAKERNDIILNIAKTTSSLNESVYAPHDGPLQMTIHAEKGLDVRAKALRDVTVTVYAPNGRPQYMIYSPKAQWEGGANFKFENAFANQLDPSSSMAAFVQAKNLQTVDLKATLQDFELIQDKPETMTFDDLRAQIARAKASGTVKKSDILQDETNLWSKIAMPFASLVFALIGAPLGLRPQRSSKYTGWMLAVLIIFGYYVISTVMGSFARGGHCSPILAAFMPNLIGVLIGSYLIWKQSH